MYIFGYKTKVFIQNLYIFVKFFGKNFIFRVKSKNFLFFQDQMYILVKFFGKNYIFIVKIQNLYILVKFFGKNFIFSVKSTKFFGKHFIFRVKSKIFFIFQDQMYIFGYKTSFYPNFSQKLHF